MEPLDVYDPAFLADPYPAYARLRDEDPVHRVSDGTWLLSRYDDVTRVLRDHDRFSSSPMNMGAPGFKFLIGADPPDHTQLRRLVNKPFHPAAIGQMEPRIRSICNGLMDELLEANESGDGRPHPARRLPAAGDRDRRAARDPVRAAGRLQAVVRRHVGRHDRGLRPQRRRHGGDGDVRLLQRRHRRAAGASGRGPHLAAGHAAPSRSTTRSC